jgi:hypothetical protein
MDTAAAWSASTIVMTDRRQQRKLAVVTPQE